MPAPDNRAIVRRYIEEVINTGNVDRIEDFIAPEYTEVYDGRRYPIGIAGARDHVRGVRTTYPDLRVTIDSQIADGEWVATTITARGSHRGEWMGISPTGRTLTFTGVNLDRVVNGRIVEHGGAANMLMPLLEAGAIKPVDAPPGRSIGTVPQVPLETEYAEYYRRYVALVTESNILSVLHDQSAILHHLASSLPPDREQFRYAEGKWTIREVVGHLIDAERIFGLRAFCFSRGEQAHLPSFDENRYVASARNDERPLRELVQEFTAVRAANLAHLYTLGAPEWATIGTASGHPVSVRAIAYIMAGHVRHHLGVLRERYGVNPP